MMPKRIKFEGQIQKFPDDFSDDEISQALSGTNSAINNNAVVSQEKSPERTLTDVGRDLLGGLAGTVQKGTSGVLEAGEYLTRKGAEKLGRDFGNPINIPKWNAREFMGLEGNNQQDFQKQIQSRNPDWLTGVIGGIVPALLAGGASLPGQAISQGLYGASQASPNEKNVFGLLPEGRLGAGIKDAASVFAGGKLLPLAAKGIGNIFSTLKSAFNKINPREVSQSVQAAHDALLKSSEDIFENVGKTAKARGADTVSVNSNLIDKITPYLADTRAVKSFLQKARQGDYSSLRKLQADLFRSGTKAERANTLADDLKAQEIFDLRDRINESISKHFRKNGHEDLANDLDKARSMYRNLKETYYNKKLPMAVRDLVHPDVRKMPKNALNTFSEESKPMARLIKQNPMVAEKIEQHIAKKNALKKLKHIGTGAAVGTGAASLGYGGKKAYEHYTD